MLADIDASPKFHTKVAAFRLAVVKSIVAGALLLFPTFCNEKLATEIQSNLHFLNFLDKVTSMQVNAIKERTFFFIFSRFEGFPVVSLKGRC